jgi:protein ImuB
VEVARAVELVTDTLRRFSPNVEPSAEEPGVFWLDAAGLQRVYASPVQWADAALSALVRDGYDAVIAVGFTRFGVYAAARASRRGSQVFDTPDGERAAVRSVMLRDLHLPPDTLDALGRLGIRNVDDLLRLPAAGLLERFGVPVERLHRRASGDVWAPLMPHPASEPVRRHLMFDDPEDDAQRLLFIVKQALHPLLARLASRGQALAALDLRLRLGRQWTSYVIRPAAPTLDVVRLADLVRLRVEDARLEAGVAEICLDAAGTPAEPEQLALLAEQPPRDLEAGTRALDRLRARYGDEAVVHAVLRDAHLPEARFAWEPMTHLGAPHPVSLEGRSLVRRVFARPVPLWTEPGEHAAGGPFIVSGGWWAAAPRDDGVSEAHRTYYFMEGPGGDVWWVFYDQARRRWYVQGQVE